MSRSTFFRDSTAPWLLVAVLVATASPSPAQTPSTRPITPPVSTDPPLYRDPDPTEGPRVLGPLLVPRSPAPQPAPPPPPSGSASPFQANGFGPPPVETEVTYTQPVLSIPPMLPPLPMVAMMPRDQGIPFVMSRTTQIHGPNGVLGRFHGWFHDTVFGPAPPSPPRTAWVPKFFLLRSLFPGNDDSPGLFTLPSWWPGQLPPTS